MIRNKIHIITNLISMPGFIRTQKDEDRWKRAKKAAEKSTAKDSESYWKLSNYIYHKMGKTEGDAINSRLSYSQLSDMEKASIENFKDFQAMGKSEKQSIVCSEVKQMADEKKYTAREAAIAVLKKTEEVLKKSDLFKKSEIQATAKDATPPDNVEKQTPPDQNPKEQAEGNNKEWGTAPETYGALKLAKFLGYMESKRKSKNKMPGQ